jgi:hypothetical protein
MSFIATIVGSAIAKKVLEFLWDYKWWIGGAVAVVITAASMWGMKQYIDHLQTKVAAWKSAAEHAVQINTQMAMAMIQLEQEKEASEKALLSKLTRKSYEADRLGKLVQHVMAQEKSNACAASPSVRALLDSLRRGQQ